MSYANLINQACASNAETFQRIRDFVCKRNGTYDYSADGIGWTLHDSSYAADEDTLTANDYVVFKSLGESGKHGLYFKLTYKATYMDLVGYLYWDNTTHAGVRSNGASASNVYTPSGATTLWVYGDLDAVVLGYSNGATYYIAIFGTIRDGESFYNNTVATSVGAITAGSSVVVTLDLPLVAVPIGAKVYLWDNASCEICTVTDKDTTTITLDTVSSGKASGCRIAGDMCYFTNSQGTLSSGVGVVANRTTGASSAGVNIAYYGYSAALQATETLNSKKTADPAIIGYSSVGIYGWAPHIKVTNATSMTQGATYTDTDGTMYRLLKANTYAFLVKEV